LGALESFTQGKQIEVTLQQTSIDDRRVEGITTIDCNGPALKRRSVLWSTEFGQRILTANWGDYSQSGTHKIASFGSSKSYIRLRI
jgi:hypothetical protein